jgi:hypothetical protein
MFPSRVQVFRNQEMSRHIVTVLGYYGGGLLWGCCATGATPTEAEEKAHRWTWQNVERHAAAGCLQARFALLERALVELLETIRAGG